MPFTPEQLVKMHQKEASLPDALKRDADINYLEGWFFVTLNTRDEAPVLSQCVGDARIPDGQPGAPSCRYTELGKGVIEAWKRNAEVYDNVIVDMCEAMPEHFHGLIYLKKGNKRHLGQIISGFMSGCTHAYWDTLGIDWHQGRFFEDARASKWQDRDRDHTRSYRGPALFVRGYNDMEALTPEAVAIKRAYIRDQARKRLIQGDRHECFQKHRHQHSRNWTVERALQAIAADPQFARFSDRREKAMRNILSRLNVEGSIAPSALLSTSGPAAPLTLSGQQRPTTLSHLPSGQQGAITPSHLPSGQQGAVGRLSIDYMGPSSLLSAPRKLSLICHRADAALFEQQKEAVLRATAEGAVIVSAFISPKERAIRDELLQSFRPVIEILDNGFGDRYKPTGGAFYAMAEQRLVQVSPWSYCYDKDLQVSREMCLVMNELVRIITDVNDDWWK